MCAEHTQSFVYKISWVVAALLVLSSVGGLLFGTRGWYDPTAPTLPALLAQDVITLLFAVPLLVASAIHAHRRGSTRAVLCWMGALFYVAYFYFFYVVGIRFNAMFPAYIAVVSMSMYGALALMYSLNLAAIRGRFVGRTPVRLTAGFLIVTAILFAVLWALIVLRHVTAGTELDSVSRLVIAVDGVVLLPLTFFGGLWLWESRPLGYALAGLLLVKVAATFLTLSATSAVVAAWGQPVDPTQSTAFFFGAIFSLSLLASYLRSIGPPAFQERP